MKIMFVAPRFHTNQIPVINALIKRGYHIDFYSYYVGGTEDHQLIKPKLIKPSFFYKIKVKFLYKRMSGNKFESYNAKHFKPSIFFVVRNLIKVRPDIIILRNYAYTTKIYNLISSLINIGKPILYIQKPCYVENIEKKANKLSNNIKNKLFKPKFIISPILAEQASIFFYHPEKLTMQNNYYFVPFIANHVEQCNRSYFYNNKINILSVGKFRDYKNHYCLVKAIKSLNKILWNEIKVTIVGQSLNDDEIKYEEELKNYIYENGLSEVIKIKTNIPYKDMTEIYRSNDIFVLSSFVEIASISIIEAMSNGLVVVSTDYNGTSTYFKNNEFGFIFDPNNPSELCNILNNLIEDKYKLPILGDAAQKHIIQNYSYKNYIEAIETVFDKISGIQ